MTKRDGEIQWLGIKKGKIFDISVSLSPDTPVFPGQKRFNKKPLFSITKGDGKNISELSLNSHTGTHVDSPFHYIEEGPKIDEVPLGNLVGLARVFELDVRQKIGINDLEPLKIQAGEIVLFKTRNSKLWKKKDFTEDYVFLTEQAAKYLATREVRAVGVDYLIPEDLKNMRRPVHHILLGKGIILIEGLDLIEVPAGKYLLVCLPLKIAGGDAAPARAILIDI